jgi:thiol-disulfide isomerase/thioredoxin
VTQSNEGKDEKGALRGDQSGLMFGQGFSFSGYERDPLYLNLGNKKFMDISGVSGIDSITDGRAGVFADFDNDGDLDVFSTTIQNQAHLLFRNNVGTGNHLRVVLEGGVENTIDAFGSVVRVKTSAGILTKIKSGGSGFISQHDPRLLFGLGKDARAEWLEVTWANGKVERFSGDFLAGSTVKLKEGSGRSQGTKLIAANLPDPLTKAETIAQGLKIVIGRPLPDFQVRSMNGVAGSIKRQMKPGRQTLINIWATWCIPCAKEMPELEAMRKEFSGAGIDLLGLNVDVEKNANVRRYVGQKRVTYPIVIGGVSAIEQIYATEELTVPLTILVDEKGIVRDLISGWSAETQKKFKLLVGAGDGQPRIPVISPKK